jgi:hypothetical protein
MAGGKKDFLVTELHPGVTRPSVQIFEIPARGLKTGTTGTRLVIPQKGLFGHKAATVVLASADGKARVAK